MSYVLRKTRLLLSKWLIQIPKIAAFHLIICYQILSTRPVKGIGSVGLPHQS